MVGVGVIVNDDFVRDLKTPPHFWLGPELTKRILRGESPLLSEKQIRDANSSGGLNHVVWEGCALRELKTTPNCTASPSTHLFGIHRGYLWKEVISPADGQRRAAALDAEDRGGGLLWDDAADRYVDTVNGNAEDIVRRPHVVGVCA